MNKPLSSAERTESARKILNGPASTIAELEAAKAVLSHVLAEGDVELEGMASRRKAVIASDAPGAEIDKQLERHDEAMRQITRRNEIAAAISLKLDERIAADCAPSARLSGSRHMMMR